THSSVTRDATAPTATRARMSGRSARLRSLIAGPATSGASVKRWGASPLAHPPEALRFIRRNGGEQPAQARTGLLAAKSPAVDGALQAIRQSLRRARQVVVGHLDGR